VAWQYGMRIPPGEIRGLVLRENGDPLEHALVDLPDLGIRSMTGPDGAFQLKRFHLGLLSQGSGSLHGDP
jgi:hypothetical protein